MPFWIAGGVAGEEPRLVLWAIAVAIDLAAPAFGYWVPGREAVQTSAWRIHGEYMAERCGLFIIIALGETVLTSGAAFAELAWDAPTTAALVTIFVAIAAMWWIYFGLGAGAARRRIAASEDPGSIARFGYTYLHMPILAGIILVAVGFEGILFHPLGFPALQTVLLPLLGGASLYVIGVAGFKWAGCRRLPLVDLTGLAAIAVLAALGRSLEPLPLCILATAILVATAAAEFATSRAIQMWHVAE